MALAYSSYLWRPTGPAAALSFTASEQFTAQEKPGHIAAPNLAPDGYFWRAPTWRAFWRSFQAQLVRLGAFERQDMASLVGQLQTTPGSFSSLLTLASVLANAKSLPPMFSSDSSCRQMLLLLFLLSLHLGSFLSLSLSLSEKNSLGSNLSFVPLSVSLFFVSTAAKFELLTQTNQAHIDLHIWLSRWRNIIHCKHSLLRLRCSFSIWTRLWDHNSRKSRSRTAAPSSLCVCHVCLRSLNCYRVSLFYYWEKDPKVWQGSQTESSEILERARVKLKKLVYLHVYMHMFPSYIKCKWIFH